MTLKLLTAEYVKEAARLDAERRAEKKTRDVEGFPFWPHEVVRDTIIFCVFTAGLLYLCAFMPYFLEAPADPSGQPEVILPDWYLLFSYGLLKIGNDLQILNGPDGAWVESAWHFWDTNWWKPWDGGPHTGTVRVPIMGPLNAKNMGLSLHIPLLAPLFVLPFIDRGKAQRPQEQPGMAAWGVWGLTFALTASIYAINTVLYDRPEAYLKALAKPVGEPQISPVFQFAQWDVLSWICILLPIVAALLTYGYLKRWKARAMAAGDRVFKLNRNYHRVR